MAVFEVTFKPHVTDYDSGHRFDLIETMHETIADLLAELNSGQIVSGSNLYTKKSTERRERIIYRRRPIAFGLGAVDHIGTPTWRFVEEEAQCPPS